MHDLDLLTEMGERLDPSVPGAPARLRARVLAGLDERSRPAPSRRRPWLRRAGWRLTAAGGLATVIAAALIALQLFSVGLRSPAIDAEAADILDHAAATARTEATPAVRPDQFVYVESMTAYSGDRLQRRIWWSVDGTGDGQLQERPRPANGATGTGPFRETPLPGCRNGQQAVTPSAKAPAGTTQPCTPLPAYLGDLPTDRAGMLAYLYHASSGGKSPDQQAFVTVGDLLRESYVPPASLAALFEAAASIPGTTVVHGVVDAAGRRGVAVGRTSEGLRQDLIFDSRTFAYLGERDLDGAGRITGEAARLQIAIVDRPGLLP